MTQEMHMGVNLGREGVEIMRTLEGFVSGGKERWQWARLEEGFARGCTKLRLLRLQKKLKLHQTYHGSQALKTSRRQKISSSSSSSSSKQQQQQQQQQQQAAAASSSSSSSSKHAGGGRRQQKQRLVLFIFENLISADF
jgi:hypothetical protein